MPGRGQGRARGRGARKHNPEGRVGHRQEVKQTPVRNRVAENHGDPPGVDAAGYGNPLPPKTAVHDGSDEQVSEEVSLPLAVPKPNSLIPFRYLSDRESRTRLQPFVRKPSPSNVGRRIEVITNYFPLQIPDGSVYHYDICIESIKKSLENEIESRQPIIKKYRCLNTRKNREVVDAMIKQCKAFENIYPAFDGEKNLITRKPLPSTLLKLSVTLTSDGKPDIFEVQIRPVQKKDSNSCAISLHPIHELCAGRTNFISEETVMALEIILRHGPALRLIPIGRSFYREPDQHHSLGRNREIWFGHHQSVHLGQRIPLFNIDTSATVFYESVDVLDFICNILKLDPDRLCQLRLFRDSDIALLSKELRSLKIEVTHMEYPRKYRIHKLTREPANRVTFVIDRGAQKMSISVADYFKQQYNRTLRFPNFPCLQALPETKKTYLPLEVCKLLKGQHCKKKLTDDQAALMIKQTAVPPRDRFRKISKIIQQESFNNDPCVKEFGLRINTQPLQISGRVLDPPVITYRNKQIKPNDGSWDMRNAKFYSPASIQNWLLLSFASSRFCSMNALEQFITMLINVGNQLGMAVERPADVKVMDNPSNIKDILQRVKHQYNAKLAVIVLSSRFSIYSEIKRMAETQCGLITQCVKDFTVVKKCNTQVIVNLCQKINAKMGGINSTLFPEEKPAILKRPIIIIGADVSHPSPGELTKPSVAALVGSLDPHLSRYAVTVRIQCFRNEKRERVEIIQDLESMVVDLLSVFLRQTKGRKPEKIVFYRDGVSDGEFLEVRDREIALVRSACFHISNDASYKPEITFIVVRKNHHTKFAPFNDHDGVGRARNVPPGTIVDSGITHPLNFDFFLCSQFGIQGTSKPAHYTVLWDENNFSANDLQSLTYQLCHVYSRCTRTISIPVPVQYAHLAAYRARQYLNSFSDGSSEGSDIPAANVKFLDEMIQAIKVHDSLKGSMYFV